MYATDFNMKYIQGREAAAYSRGESFLSELSPGEAAAPGSHLETRTHASQLHAFFMTGAPQAIVGESGRGEDRESGGGGSPAGAPSTSSPPAAPSDASSPEVARALGASQTCQRPVAASLRHSE
jgi:hypothetical protein